MQRRRCTHVSPVFRHSSHPAVCGCTFRISLRWLHRFIALLRALLAQSRADGSLLHWPVPLLALLEIGSGVVQIVAGIHQDLLAVLLTEVAALFGREASPQGTRRHDCALRDEGTGGDDRTFAN